jgi:membrane protease subunit HflK
MLEGRAQPGLHYALPYPVDRIILLRINEAQRLSIGGTDLGQALGVARVGEADYLLTGDQNLVRTRASIQYYIQAPHLYLFRTEDLTSSF